MNEYEDKLQPSSTENGIMECDSSCSGQWYSFNLVHRKKIQAKKIRSKPCWGNVIKTKLTPYSLLLLHRTQKKENSY